jgi:hypothetical protein
MALFRGPAALLGAALAVAGCASAPERPPPDPAEQAYRAVFAPALAALQAALAEGDDAAAERILAQLVARDPEGAVAERVEACARVLTGRRLARGLSLRLECEPAREPGAWQVWLRASHALQEPIALRGAAASLQLLLIGLGPNGLEERAASSHPASGLDGLLVPPGAGARVRLVTTSLPAGAWLAVRATWDLEFPPCDLAWNGRRYPARELTVQPCEAVRLAPWLPQAPVEPAELASYVQRTSFSTAAMLERAVRIEPARRAEALELLSEPALRYRLDLHRLAPALRWLSGFRGPMGDGERWREWLAERQQRDAPPASEHLDLPERPAVLAGAVRSRP